jgi:hypothetical protein
MTGEDQATPKELTFGEKAVGLTFNPDGNEKVDEVKKLYATIIDLCSELRKDSGSNEIGKNEKGRLLSLAITEAQTAQMWAVKAITWKD